MPIIETRILHRSSPDTPWFHETDYVTNVYKPKVQSYYDSGSISSTNSLDSTGLILTRTVTFADLSTLSVIDSFVDIDYDITYRNYVAANNITFGGYTQTGIDQPFTSTTVYTATDSANEYFAELNQILAVDAISNLVQMTATGNTITLVHQFANSEDYSSDGIAGWLDYEQCENMKANGITRTVTYALV